MLAGTPKHFFGFGNLLHFGCKAGAFVGAIAKGLVAAFAAGAPEVGAWLYIHHNRGFLRYVWLVHVFLF